MDDNELQLYLQIKLESAFPGWPVYYRPSGNIILPRPCIVYEPLSSSVSYANSTPYVYGMRFKVTILSDLPGVNKRPMFYIPGILVEDNNSFVAFDIVNDVFTVSINSI